MNYTWDESKAAANLTKHGVAFLSIKDFDWDAAVVEVDSRRDYGELRLIAASTIRGRHHVLVYTRRGNTVRVISVRKANQREISKYEKAKS